MKKLTIFILIAGLVQSCNSSSTPQHINATHPFAQGVLGKVKKMHIYKNNNFVSTADSITYLLDDYSAYTALHYNEEGQLLSRTITEGGVTMKQIIEYGNGKETGFYIMNKNGGKAYRATTKWQGATNSITTMINKNQDTTLIITNNYDEQLR